MKRKLSSSCAARYLFVCGCLSSRVGWGPQSRYFVILYWSRDSGMMSSTKKYGLILPEKTKLRQPVFQASRNVFGNDSESDDESKRRPVLLRSSDNINRQAKIAQQNALIEDPTVYQYDEIYDSMASKKEEKKAKTKEEKKPRYIENLIKSANKRKIENERRVERQIQKEREKEGDEFADKEVFVTSAYKKKLEEMSLEEEREKREEYLESIGDVTKQSDLGGFYRHLYEQKLGSEKTNVNKNIMDKEKDARSCKEQSKSKNNIIKMSDDATEVSKKRNYRKRKTSSDNAPQLSDGEIEDSGDEINRINLDDIRKAKKMKNEENIDADSDFSIDESSDEDEHKKISGKPSEETQRTIQVDDEHTKIKNVVEKESKNLKNENIQSEVIPKVDIWKKRTVGEVFEQALKRYYERKAARGV